MNINTTVDEIYTKFICGRHPVLQQMMFIIVSLYEHFYFQYKQLKLMKQRFDTYFKSYTNKGGSNLSKRYHFHDKHGFMWSETNDADKIWFLARFYKVSNKKYMESNRKRLCCVTCGKNKQTLRICKGCRLVFYCNKKCQKYDWVRNGHRESCNLIHTALAIWRC